MLFYFSKFPAAFSQNLNWVKQIQGTGSDFLKSMTSDASGNIYTVGTFTETIDFDPDAGVRTSLKYGCPTSALSNGL